MTCQEFTDQLPDYLDETREAAARTDTQRHLEACRECQLALQRTQALGCALQGALERETAHLTLTPGAQETILRATRAAVAEASAGRSAWRWLFGHPVGALAAAAALAAVLLVAGQRQWRRGRVEHPHARSTWSIDVPFQFGRDAGVIHADFAEP